jgi:hypothetical protein
MVPTPPKTGPLPTSDLLREGIVYWMLFDDPGQYLKPGNLAAVVIRDFRAENCSLSNAISIDKWHI